MPASDELDRLLRAAARAEAPGAEMPFGFDTRVLARARGYAPSNGGVLAVFLRRIAVAALLVGACAGSAAWWQLQQVEEIDSPTATAYAMADRVIEAGSWQ